MMLRLLALLCCLTATIAQASESRIVAVVGDDIISSYDVQQQVKLALVSSGIKDSPETRQKFAGRALQNLIAEALQRQEAARLGLKVSDKELRGAIASLEQQNEMPPGGLAEVLRRANIPFSVMENQLRTNVLWAKAVQRRYGNRVSVAETDVERTLKRLQANSGKPEYQLAEIFIPTPTETDTAEAKRTADNLVEQLKSGASFPSLARQFSQSATAATGGDRGWSAVDDIPSALQNAVSQMQVGQLTPPLKAPEGYYVLYLRNKRLAGVGSTTADDNAEVDLYQLVFPTATATSRPEAERTARQKTVSLRGCDAAASLASRENLAGSGNLGTLKLRDMPPPLRQAMLTYNTGEATPPAWLQNRYVVFMACSKRGFRVGKAQPLPTRDMIRSRLRSQTIERFAEQYLQQLRRSALIEIKK